jgi:multiple sugar transport system substrate-binding protein
MDGGQGKRKADHCEAEMERRNTITRREFVKHGVAATAGIAALGVLGNAFVGCATPTPTPTPTFPAAVGVPTVVSGAPISTDDHPHGAKGRYKGTTLRVGVGSFMSKGVSMFVPQWEEETGGRVQISDIPFSEVYPKLMASFSGSGEFDLIFYAGIWKADFIEGGYIVPLDDYIPKYYSEKRWNDVFPKIREELYTAGHYYSLPMDGDVCMGYYRKDALENKEYQGKFKAKYGYDLPVPPVDWKQYQDIAEFFTGWDWDNRGKNNFGAMEGMMAHNNAFFYFMERAMCYVQNDNAPGYIWFNPETMEPLINSPAYVRTLDEWKAMLPFLPPDVMNIGGAEIRGQFPGGIGALCLDWADPGIISQDESRSAIKGKIGHMMTPGSVDTYNHKTKQWEKRNKVTSIPYLGWASWQGSVTNTCKNVEAAVDFLSWQDSNENSFVGANTPGTVRNPYRLSNIENPELWKTGPMKFDDSVEQYLDVFKKSFEDPKAVQDLKVPGTNALMESMDNAFQRALFGGQSSQESLDQAYEEWKKIVDDRGKEKVKEYYLYGTGLKK